MEEDVLTHFDNHIYVMKAEAPFSSCDLKQMVRTLESMHCVNN